MVVLECIVFGSLAAVVVSELYILKKLFTENNFPYVNNSTPTPITSLFGNRSEYAWQIEGTFSFREHSSQAQVDCQKCYTSSYNFSQQLIRYAFFKLTVTIVTALWSSYCFKQDGQRRYNQERQVLLLALMFLEFKYSLKWSCTLVFIGHYCTHILNVVWHLNIETTSQQANAVHLVRIILWK